ncbi:hypothetical protein DY000_02013666 [Brassica cretica]|uniref:Uncharacterized protein n=1 Tax=Brassica cretica TaxID=69181 RepID=A0ABQ7DD42_BRACR|nr:hypothetical protein DY000_02013666 [Brassica cretica]
MCSMPETEREEEPVMMDFSHLMASLNQAQHELPNVRRLLTCFDSVLSGDHFCGMIYSSRGPIQAASLVQAECEHFLSGVPHIPEPVYTDIVNWINREISDDTLSDFVVESFGYISDSMLAVPGSMQTSYLMFLADGLPSLWKQALPLTVWMIKQVPR